MIKNKNNLCVHPLTVAVGLENIKLELRSIETHVILCVSHIEPSFMVLKVVGWGAGPYDISVSS